MNESQSKFALVSCVVIFLNTEKFITEAIESIFAQTYENWELLLVDDGSTDKSTQIALEYARNYPEKIRYLEHIEHQNRGMSASRNLGVAHSKGEYIAFLDADDVWLKEKLEQQLTIFQFTPEAAVVYGKTLFWYSHSGKAEDQEKDRFWELGVQPNTLVFPPILLINLLRGGFQAPTTCNAIIRRTVFLELGGFEEQFRTFYEDQAFFTKVFLNAPVYVSDRFWAKYRKHNESSSSLFRENFKQQFFLGQAYFNWLDEYLIKQAIKEPLLLQLVQKNKFSYQNIVLYWFSENYINLLNILMNIGRKILPAWLRNWLWLSVGRKMFDVS